ncbi:MAG TPA: NAD-dependent dihydropyrimidine dehydrogenase subunit PreA [Thermoanaerobaculia bacterium]|nr:NAD-dependent dihydropyrimidine dehydrogenase subunit PreA [Thermoanaerobaculia bacterium]
MTADLSVVFTGLKFENPFLLSSAPPTESESNILRAFEAGWAGVVTKTIGVHPVVNVKGPKTNFMRTDPATGLISMKKRAGAALHSSWNWELISDKPLDWWIGRLARIKKAHPTKVLIASIMAGSGSDEELRHWQTLAKACQEDGADALELNLSCPHMDRPDMGSNIGRDQELISVVAQVVKEVATVPVWAKLTPSTTDIVLEARGAFLGGADAISSSNTFTSLPVIDPQTLEFEMNVEGYVSTGGLGGPAILPLSLAKMSQMTGAFPDKEFSGIGGIAEFAHALNYFLLGCGTVQVCTAAMLDHAVGPNVIKNLTAGMEEFFEKNAHRGWTKLDDFRGLRRDRIVPHSQIKRPEDSGYHGGYETEAPPPPAAAAHAKGTK